MNNYIIDPAVFYWMNVLSIMQTVFAIFGAILTLAGIGFIIGYVYNNHEKKDYSPEGSYYDEYVRNEKLCKFWAKALLFSGIPLILASIFIPSKQTSIEMLVARTATFDNVNWTVQQVKEIVDYIVSALKGAV